MTHRLLAMGRGRAVATALALGVVATVLTGCTAISTVSLTPPSTDVGSDDATVETVGPEVLTQREVTDAAPPSVGGGEVIDLANPCHGRDAAIAVGIEDELLALWAVDTGLAAASATRAVRIEAARAEIRRTREPDVTPAQVEEWLAAHDGDFRRIETAQVTWAQFDSAESALSAMGSDPAGLAPAAVPALSARSGSGTADHAGSGVPEHVARVAFALKAEGAVGFTNDGDHAWLVGIEELRFEPPDTSPTRVEQLRQVALEGVLDTSTRQLTDGLRNRWPVHQVATCSLRSAVLGE